MRNEEQTIRKQGKDLKFTQLIAYILYYNTSCCPKLEQREVFIMNHCPEKIKREVFTKYLCGYTPIELANEFGIHFTTIYRWIERWKKDLSEHTLEELPFQDMGMVLEYIKNLRRQVDEAERSLSIIHESKVLQTIPFKERVGMTKKYIEAYPVKLLCRTFEIPVSTLYYYRRKARDETKRQKEERDLSDAIRTIFMQCRGRLGSERIRVLLQEKGITVSKRRVGKLMKQMGLSSNKYANAYYPSNCGLDLEEGADVKIL